MSTSAHAQCGVHNDFLVRSDALLAPVRPADCETVAQTPPDFTWPPQEGHSSYTLSLRLPDGRIERSTTTYNFITWPRVLPPGDYSWRLKAEGRQAFESDWRKFSVPASAVEFVVPSPDEAVTRARSTPRPRTWPHDATSPVASAKNDRADGLRQLTALVDQSLRQPLPPDPRGRSKDQTYDDAIDEAKRTMASSLAWALTHNPVYGMDGARRLINLALWNPRGPAGYNANDMAGRTIAWTLALGYDWMHDYLNPSQRDAIVAAVRAHGQAMFEDVIPRMSTYPYDSHGNISLTLMAAIGALMAGDMPEADEWLRSTLSMAVVWTSPWGGPDGGFGNGTGQMFWDTQSNLPAWYVFRNAVGVDLAKKDWVRNVGRAMAYFIPPGTPTGLFGDGQEQNLQELWARVGKAYASFVPSPLSRWYAQQMKGEDPSRIELLLAPKTEAGRAELPAGTESAAMFPSIGWAALHSNLADPLRTSVYFKSSPYGSYNHSHGDQNSFVVIDKGKPLAIASGYYDGYRTQHWTQWYKQTRSSNAITFDGGHGQGFNERRFSGAITRFGHSEAFDLVVGHAEKAYGEALTQAQRSLAYLRPSTIVVYDALASDTARTWEWNIHALHRMTEHGEGRISLVNGDANLCVEMLAGPPLAFSQTDQYTAPPEDQKKANEWHGKFASTRKSQRAEFVALMRVGADCSRPSGASATRVEGGWQVAVAGRTVTFAGDDVSLR